MKVLSVLTSKYHPVHWWEALGIHSRLGPGIASRPWEAQKGQRNEIQRNEPNKESVDGGHLLNLYGQQGTSSSNFFRTGEPNEQVCSSLSFHENRSHLFKKKFKSPLIFLKIHAFPNPWFLVLLKIHCLENIHSHVASRDANSFWRELGISSLMVPWNTSLFITDASYIMTIVWYGSNTAHKWWTF